MINSGIFISILNNYELTIKINMSSIAFFYHTFSEIYVTFNSKPVKDNASEEDSKPKPKKSAASSKCTSAQKKKKKKRK